MSDLSRHYFFDRNISPRLAKMVELFDLDATVTPHDERFAQNAKDIEWIGSLTEDKSQPVVVTGDPRIMQNKAEAQALAGSGLTFFFLWKGFTKLNHEDQTITLLKAWTNIRSKARARRPMLFQVRSNGKIDEIGPTDKPNQWKK